MSKGYTVTNSKDVQQAIKNLSKFLRKLDTIPTEELEKSAQIIKAEAIEQAPYKSGKLEKSIYVIVSRDKRRPGLRAGASARAHDGYNYAGIQHDNEEFNHPVKGKDHFISDPFNAEVVQLKKRLRKRLKVK